MRSRYHGRYSQTSIRSHLADKNVVAHNYLHLQITPLENSVPHGTHFITLTIFTKTGKPFPKLLLYLVTATRAERQLR